VDISNPDRVVALKNIAAIFVPREKLDLGTDISTCHQTIGIKNPPLIG
jgi:hypothetical protein